MGEKVNEMLSQKGNMVAAIVQLLIAAVLIPWGTWVTRQLSALTADSQENKSWHVGQDKAFETETRAIKLEVAADVEKMVRALVEKSEAKQDRILQDLRDSDREVRNTAAQVVALKDSVTTMATTIQRMNADVRQALINSDFDRNAESKGAK